MQYPIVFAATTSLLIAAYCYCWTATATIATAAAAATATTAYRHRRHCHRRCRRHCHHRSSPPPPPLPLLLLPLATVFDIMAAWEESRTGYPWIDAIMKQLTTEGWIHHLARCVTASARVYVYCSFSNSVYSSAVDRHTTASDGLHESADDIALTRFCRS